MDSEQQLYTIILRHDTSTNWTINDTVLAFGEYGVEDDTHRIKRGNGKNGWSELPYEDFGLKLNLSLDDGVSIKDMLDKKLDKENLKSVIEDINVKQENLIELTKLVKDPINNINEQKTLVKIESSDDSIQGTWTVDTNGKDILDLKVNFKYDNTNSGLTATTIQDAIDEVVDTVDNKVGKTTEPNKVYGTDENGEQTVLDISDLGGGSLPGGSISSDNVKIGEETLTDKIKQIEDSKLERTIVTNISEMTDTNKLYLLPNGKTETNENIYDEYMVIEEDGTKKLERIGSTDADLTDYIKDKDIQSLTNVDIDRIFNSI